MGTKQIRMNEVKIWKEERLFTKWLCNHIDYVGDVIGKKISLAKPEAKNSDIHGKGKYPVDILAYDENGNTIVIENQYYLSNHIHLGEAITYAAWHEASTVVWITEHIDKEHLQAVKYLNTIAQNCNRDFKFWLLLVEPNEATYLSENPDIILKVADESDIKEYNSPLVLPQNADLNLEFWKIFKVRLLAHDDFNINRAGRSDCITLGWNKSYNMNVPFRKDNIKIEVHFNGNYKDTFYDAINEDWEQIKGEIELEKYDAIELIESPAQIRITIPAQVTNINKWDTYIDKMIYIILKLREIVDRYEFCF